MKKQIPKPVFFAIAAVAAVGLVVWGISALGGPSGSTPTPEDVKGMLEYRSQSASKAEPEANKPNEPAPGSEAAARGGQR